MIGKKFVKKSSYCLKCEKNNNKISGIMMQNKIALQNQGVVLVILEKQLF